MSEPPIDRKHRTCQHYDNRKVRIRDCRQSREQISPHALNCSPAGDRSPRGAKLRSCAYCTARSVRPLMKTLSQRPLPPAVWAKEESAAPAGPLVAGKKMVSDHCKVGARYFAKLAPSWLTACGLTMPSVKTDWVCAVETPVKPTPGGFNSRKPSIKILSMILNSKYEYWQNAIMSAMLANVPAAELASP